MASRPKLPLPGWFTLMPHCVSKLSGVVLLLLGSPCRRTPPCHVPTAGPEFCMGRREAPHSGPNGRHTSSAGLRHGGHLGPWGESCIILQIPLLLSRLVFPFLSYLQKAVCANVDHWRTQTAGRGSQFTDRNHCTHVVSVLPGLDPSGCDRCVRTSQVMTAC